MWVRFFPWQLRQVSWQVSWQPSGQAVKQTSKQAGNQAIIHNTKRSSFVSWSRLEPFANFFGKSFLEDQCETKLFHMSFRRFCVTDRSGGPLRRVSSSSRQAYKQAVSSTIVEMYQRASTQTSKHASGQARKQTSMRAVRQSWEQTGRVRILSLEVPHPPLSLVSFPTSGSIHQCLRPRIALLRLFSLLSYTLPIITHTL